ncbi:hypothetical protein MMC31_000835 [Peltigera leucophlebia]|nr:hypothetical protein [Peltigera leucophlebia]
MPTDKINTKREAQRRIDSVFAAVEASGFTFITDALVYQYEQCEGNYGQIDFRYHLIKHRGFRSLVITITQDTVNKEMMALEARINLRLPPKQVNPDILDKFSLNGMDKIYQDEAPFLCSMLHTSSNTITGIMNRSLVQCQRKTTPGSLDESFSDGSSDASTKSNSEWDVSDKDPDYASASEPKTVVGSRKDRWQNKALIAIVCLSLLGYTYNKNINLLQVVNRYFGFAQNVPKRCIEVLHQMGVMVSGETICRSLQYNATAIVELLKDLVANEAFFVLYDNMNFYEKVREQRMYNQNHQVNYTAGYICFMKGNEYLYSSSVDYSAVNSFEPEDFLPDDSALKHHCESAQYILSNIFEQYFSKQLRHQKQKI